MQFRDEQELVRFVITAKLEDWRAKLFKKHAEAVQVHSQGQLFYKLDKLFPNEQPQSKQHRLLSFESITESSFSRAANNVNRIFKNSSYTITASDKTIERLDENTFEGQNFYNWFLDEWVRWAMKEDANSLIAVYPSEYIEEKNLPIAFITSDFIRWMDSETVVFVSEKESDIRYNLIETRIVDTVYYDQSINKFNAKQIAENTYSPKIVAEIKKPVYHVFQKGEGFYRIEQQGGKEYSFSFYPIDKDFLPVTDIGGERGKNNVNKSFLHPFVAFGNLALLQHSQHCAVNFTFSFPRMSEVETPCDAEGCVGGQVVCESEETPNGYPEGFKPCNICRGSGFASPQSPYRIYKKRYDPQGVAGDDEALKYPIVEYYTPPVAILTYSKEEWKDYLAMAETAVYIQQRVQTGNVQAAKSKEIDREDLYAFLTQVAKVFFAKMRFAIQCLENYTVGNPLKVAVQTPYSFAILSEGEAFTELQNILASNVPVMIKANRVESFISKFVSQSSPIRKFLEVLKVVDPLLYYSKDELTAFKISGAISTEQMTVHIFAYPELQKMFTEDKNLLLQEAGQVADKLIKNLEVYKPKPQDLAAKFKQPGQQPQQ